MKTWSCLGNPPTATKDLHSFACVGPEHKAINVVFSGYATLEKALAAAIPAGADSCKSSDKQYCDAQVDSMVPWQVPTRKEAIQWMTEPGSVWAATCGICLNPPKQDAVSKLAAKHPYSRSIGHPDLNKGLQFLSLGGANRGGMLNVDRFKNFEQDLPKVKAAGFQGICFDIEMTVGESELVRETEKVFAACKRNGLLVMVTTSHSAPYAAASEASKLAFVDSWVKSPHIDIFSPQLYSRGREPEPELMETPCVGHDNLVSQHCSYKYLKQMRAIWMPSLANSGHYEASKKFFASEGIHVRGFIQWNRGHGDHDPKTTEA